MQQQSLLVELKQQLIQDSTGVTLSFLSHMSLSLPIGICFAPTACSIEQLSYSTYASLLAVMRLFYHWGQQKSAAGLP